MSTQLGRLHRLFEFLVRVQEFWVQPWSRLEQLPWSSTLQTSFEGAPLRVAPSAPLYPALNEVFDLAAHEGFRLGLGLEWLEGPGVDCPFSYQRVELFRVESDIELKPTGPVRRRVELLRHLGIGDPPGGRFKLRPCQVLFLEPLSPDYSRFFSRLKKALQDPDDLPASLASFMGPAPAKPEPTYRQSLWSLSISPEQEEVVNKLAVRPLVVVEGGPGTGKSHLTANLLGHCLALGQRVLVTGPSAAALRPVMAHLPAELRDLCTGPGQDPAFQLEQLLKRLESVDSKNMLKEADKLKKKREELAEEVARLEQELHDRVVREYGEYQCQRVGDLGRRLLEEREQLGWIPGPVGLQEMPLRPEEVAELYDSNRLAPDEETGLAAPLPDRSAMLTPAELASLSELWKEAESYPDHNFWSGTSPVETLEYLPLAAEGVANSIAASDSWFLECIWRARTNEKHRQTYQNLLRELEQNKKDRARIADQIGDARPTLAYVDDEAQEICQELLDHVGKGGTVTGIAATFLKPRWKKFLKSAKVRGMAPTTQADFRLLLDGISLKRMENAEDHRWAQEMILLGLMSAEQHPIDRSDALKRALNWSRDVFSDFEHQSAASGLQWERAMDLVPEQNGSGRVLKRLLAFLENELEPLLERRRAYLRVCLLMKRADQQARDLKAGSKSSPNPIWGSLRQALVDRNEKAYQQALDQLGRWELLAPLAQRRRELLERLERVAPAWADAVARREREHGRAEVPGDVGAAWEHRQAAQWLRSLHDQEGPEKLHSRLAEARAAWQQATAEVVRLRAWAVQTMRLGKRVHVPENGLPAWIVPLDEAVERFCPDESRFDLLIVEHASLCDLRATGLLALGERALILGDPERMAPEPTAEPQELASLSSPFLRENPHASTGSLLSWVDQGDTLKLTLPYRARPEMLHLLRALESSVAGAPGHSPARPSAPIVLHRLRLDASELTALAMAVAREQKAPSLGVICTDPMLARKVRRMLTLMEPPGRAPLVGSPVDLQGEERDIVLVAMQDGDRFVVSSADRSRLLTALGLAREQLWLLYSGDPEHDMLPGDLRRELVSQADGLSALALAPGGSSWRGMIAQALKKAGYRVHPFDERSVRVQGSQGWVVVSIYGESGNVPSRAELAWENWVEQNLGWRYLRLRASHFWHDPEALLGDVIKTLQQSGIAPLEADKLDLATLCVLKTAQDLRHDMPPPPASAVDLFSSYSPGDFNWIWQPLVRRLLAEGVAVAPADAEGYAIEVERLGRRLLVANRDFEDVDLSVDPSSLESALASVLEALGPAAAPLPRPALVTAMAPGWEGPVVQAPVAPVEVEAVWESEALPPVEEASESVAPPVEEPEEEPPASLEAEAEAPELGGWETSSWMREEPEPVAFEREPAVVEPEPEVVEPEPEIAEPEPEIAEPEPEIAEPEPEIAEPVEPEVVEPEPKKPAPAARKPAPAAKPVSRGRVELNANPTPARSKPAPRSEAEAPKSRPPAPPKKPEASRKKETAPPSPPAFFNSGRFEFGATRPAARPQRPAGEPVPRGERPQPSPPPPRPAAETKSTGSRPPAPRTGPPRTSFVPKPTRKSSPSGLDSIRELMLQAFELIQPISKQALGELVEGVSQVSLERGGRDQRRAPRLLCCYDVECETEEETFQAVVSEVSLTGVRLELSTRLPREAIVTLRAEVAGELSPVRCQVRWCRRSSEGLAAGLAFHEAPEELSRSWVAGLLHSLGFGPEHAHQRRKSLRVPTPRLRVQMEGSSGQVVGVALDLGVGGMLVESAGSLAVDDEVQLTLGPHEGLTPITVKARVANRRERKTPAFGMAFLDVTPATMKALGNYVLAFLAARARGKRA